MVLGVTILSDDKLVDFHNADFSVKVSLFKALEVLSSFVWNFTILACAAFKSAFAAKAFIFSSKSLLFINLEISDLLISSLCFIFTSSILFVN